MHLHGKTIKVAIHNLKLLNFLIVDYLYTSTYNSMQKNIVLGKNSNYDITITASKEDMQSAETRSLKHFQKDVSIQGFRKGEVPLNMVKERIDPQHIMIAIYEDIINTGLQEILQENPDIKFIGEPYDIQPQENEEHMTISLKLDIYPEVEILNTKREKHSIAAIETKPTQEEIDNALIQLKKNYANYQDHPTIELDTISKIKTEYKDKNGNILHTTNTFLGEPEFSAEKYWKETFIDKKKDESFDIKYTSKLPQQLHYTREEGKPTTITVTPIDIKKVVLPEFNEEMLKKLFGPESEVKNEKELIQFIIKSLEEQKEEVELIKAIENYVNKVRDESMKVSMPHTMVEHEYKSRLENLHKKFGNSKEKMQQFLDSMDDEKKKNFLDDIRNSAKESLEKFFILKHICDQLGLEINREQPSKLEIEYKLYEKVKK